MRSSLTIVRVGLLAVTTSLAIGCGEDDPVGSAGSIQLTVEPASLSIPQGGTGLATASLTRTGGFNGPVTLAVTGLPAGVTAVSTPAVLTGATSSAEVNVSVAGTVALGVYTASITATADGVNQATASVQLTVTAPPDFALTVTPSALTVVAGASGSTNVAIARTTFSGEVTFSLANPPTGITGAFSPSPTTTTASALVVSVAATVAPGAYQLTVAGSATPGVRNATLALTVPAPPAAGHVDYLFCDPSSAPVFFAYQDGSGPWQAVAGVTSGGATSFAFTQTQGFGGVLMVHQDPAAAVTRSPVRSPRASVSAARVDAYETAVLYASRAELAQDGFETCAGSQSTKSITGTVVGVAAGSYATVSLGGETTIYDGATATNPVTISGVPPGPVDLIASRTIPGSAPDRMLIVRNLNLANGASLSSPIDFSGPPSFVPVAATATISGGDGEDLELYTDLVTANVRGGYWSDLSPSPSTLRPWAGLPATAMMTGDLHELVVFASANDGTGDFRVSVKFVGPVADAELALGPSLDASAASQVAGGAYPRFRFQGTLPPDYAKGAEISLAGPEGGNAHSIIATGAWLTALGNGLAYDLTMPDVASLTGFPLASRLPAGTNDVTTGGFGFTGVGIFDGRPVIGGQFKAAVRNTTLVVP